MKKSLSLILALVLLIGLLPQFTLPARASEPDESKWEGKKVSILSHSMSTYAGVSNDTAANSTIGNNDIYYTEGRHNVYQKDTWWQQVIDALGMELLVNNSWSGSCVFMPRKGEASVGYGDRAVNLHNDHTGEEPDIIFVYLGCNDFAYFKDTFGKAADVDYAALIQANGDGTYTYAEPTTTCEAYAIMLHKVENRYPDAEIFCMTSTARRDPDYAEDNRADTGQPTAYSAELHNVASYLGFPIIDLENCIPKDAEIFDKYMGDKRAHANALGMDQITNEVLSVMLGKDAEICHVTSADGTVAEQAVLLGGSYRTEVELQEGYSVAVTMAGEDITAEVYNDGNISIEEVTGDIVITATAKWEPKSYRWDLQEGLLVSTGETENAMVRLEGTTENGIFIDTRYQLTKPFVLLHDQQWVLEWNMTGPWVDAASTAGKKLFSEDGKQSTVGAFAIGTKSKEDWLAINFYNGSAHVHYGIDLAEYGISLSENHTYRLYNKVAEDGSNMIWLAVDGVELGAMNTHLNAGVESDYLSGKDFSFGFLGTPRYWLDNGTITYIQVWEDGHQHSYENGICTVCGAEHPNMEDLEGKVISILGDSISTFAGYIPVADGFNLEHLARYPQDNLLTDVNETWWMQVISAVGAKLGINDSWRGATVSGAKPVTTGTTGENAAMGNLQRIQNLGANGTPDVILFYGGTNDLAHVSKVGIFDAASAPAAVDLTTTKWDNLADGYVHTLLRLQHFYPDAQIIAMLPTYTNGYYSDAKLAEGNAVLADICEHYGVTYVDLRECGISTADLPDNIHPDANGMDYITAAVIDALLNECEMEAGENVVCSVTHELTHAESSMGYYKGVSHGKPFAATITGEDVTVSVTMGGVDITGECYADGKIAIAEVTGALVITAEGTYSLKAHLQQLPDSYCGVNLWQILEHDPEYYSANGWTTHATGLVKSITFPVCPGDRLYASSFEAAGTNGGSLDGIRVTYFTEDGLLVSMTASQVYAEFSKNGCLTVPEGATAVSIPMWTDSQDWDVHFLCTLDGHLQQIPEGACNSTNLWSLLEHDAKYYSANGWAAHSSGSVKSVTFPVKVSDRLYASSFGAAGTNGGTMNGIRVTYFTQCGVLVSLTTDQVYSEFSKNGCLTVPEGATAVCIPMWNNSDDNEIYILNRDHCYENGVCQGCGHNIGLAIVTQPTDTEAKLGEWFNLAVEAEGNGLKYQWYYRDTRDGRYYRSTITDDHYTIKATAARNGRKVYCVITDALGNQVTTDVATLTVVPKEALQIISQPQSLEGTLGKTVSITMDVKGDGLTYQWYYRDVNYSKYYRSTITDDHYTIKATAARNGRKVYCVITDALGNQVTTDVATLTVVPKVPLAIVSQPTTVEGTLNKYILVDLNVQGDGLTYQWYYRDATSKKFYRSSITDAIYKIKLTKARMDREVYCVITDALGNQVTSEVITLKAVCSIPLEIVSQPAYEKVAIGEYVTIEMAVKGEELTYAWYFSPSGSDVFFKSSITDETYCITMTKDRAGRRVYCVITDAFGNQVVTETVTIHVTK